MKISKHWLGLWLTVEQAKPLLEPMTASLLTHIVTWAQCVNWLCSPNTKVTNLIAISENDISFSKNEGTGTFNKGSYYLTSQLFLVCRCNQSKRFESSGYSWENRFRREHRTPARGCTYMFCHCDVSTFPWYIFRNGLQMKVIPKKWDK